jgi:hypothetical protein
MLQGVTGDGAGVDDARGTVDHIEVLAVGVEAQRLFRRPIDTFEVVGNVFRNGVCNC